MLDNWAKKPTKINVDEEKKNSTAKITKIRMNQ